MVQKRDKIVFNGIVAEKGIPLAPPIDYELFQKRLMEGLETPKAKPLADALSAYLASIQRVHFLFSTPNLNNPGQVGWDLLLYPENEENRKIAQALAPLVELRKGKVVFCDAPPDTNWINNNYTYRPEKERPYYILLAGSPRQLPFEFQYSLDVNAAVGRLALDRVEDYAAYAEKVVSFEKDGSRQVDKRALFFATEHGEEDATAQSKRYVADPLAKMLKGKHIPVNYIEGKSATFERLSESLVQESSETAPALVFTVSHGNAVDGGAKNEEKRWQEQGALVCQDSRIFAARDVPDGKFLHGSIFIGYACFGAGSSSRSDFLHWMPDDADFKPIKEGLACCLPQEDYVAALPKRLLAHPEGPLAFIGHIDILIVESFADANLNAGASASRLGPLKQLMDDLIGGATVGYAVRGVNEAYSRANAEIATLEDKLQYHRSRGEKVPEGASISLVNNFILRNDSQNYIILGDPAIRAKYAR